MKKTTSGFTIVELLIVIVVIAILAAISIVAYNGIQQRARDSEREQDMANVQKLLELFYADNGAFPNTNQFQDPTWRAANLATKDQGAFINPLNPSASNSFSSGGSAVTTQTYSYYSLKSDNSLCVTAETNCMKYRLAWRLELANELKSKSVDR